MTLQAKTTSHKSFALPPNAAKRLVDIVASAVGLLLLVPVFAVIAIAIRLDDGGTVFYRQTRVGRGGRSFEINKFRSMTPSNRSGRSNLTVAGDQRITRLGAFLRRSKLDELPQLFNVLRGEMSLVGPRPETPDLIAHYTPAQRTAILSVRPGMTDWASLILKDESVLLAAAADPVRFYRERLMPLKYELCVHYVEEIGPMTDIRIILATIWAILLPKARNPWIERGLVGRFDVRCSPERENAIR
jgi:lipopolysaccharide/colanic/teichoic acid biosynthesis glycosyltransferase